MGEVGEIAQAEGDRGARGGPRLPAPVVVGELEFELQGRRRGAAIPRRAATMAVRRVRLGMAGLGKQNGVSFEVGGGESRAPWSRASELVSDGYFPIYLGIN